uniref:Nucleoside diphosphate-linked moiety X motif 6 n=2 Tax=Schistocephalus solidus TaxID=70667 RepID=A0A0X3P193_SCHSO
MRFSCLLLLPGRIYGRHSSSFVPFMDRHNCLHFDLSTVVPTQKNCENVQSRILEQLSAVCNEVPPRCNAVWVHLLSSQCSLLPRLCAPPPDGQGFQLHHAKPKSLSLYRWLGPGDDRVPAFTTHQVAITADATLREVYEETGLQPTFRALMGVRESNGIPSTFGTAEILALCHLSLSGSPTEIASQLKLCPIVSSSSFLK